MPEGGTALLERPPVEMPIVEPQVELPIDMPSQIEDSNPRLSHTPLSHELGEPTPEELQRFIAGLQSEQQHGPEISQHTPRERVQKPRGKIAEFIHKHPLMMAPFGILIALFASVFGAIKRESGGQH